MTLAADTALLSGVFTSSNLSGIMNELIAVIPVVVPVAVSCLAVRKAISFVMGMIRQA